MRSGLLLFILIGFLSTSVWAASYACRDSSGKLYFTDNLADVPEDCRQNLKQLDLYTPPVTDSSSPAVDNTQTNQTKAPEKTAQQNLISNDQFAQLKNRASAALQKYNQGVGLMDDASKRRRFGSKARFAVTQEMVDQAKKLITEARQEKEQLAGELKSQQLSAQQGEEIVGLLNSIK